MARNNLDNQLPGGTQGDNRKTQSYKPEDKEMLRDRGQLNANDGDAQNVRDEATEGMTEDEREHSLNKSRQGKE